MSYFPTDFAQQIGKANELYPSEQLEDYVYDVDSSKKKKRKKARALFDLHDRMASFQNLSISGDYKEAMIAYHGFVLSKKQKKVLRKIHASTTTWTKGRLVDRVLGKLQDAPSSKEVKELSEIMIKVLGMEKAPDAMGSGSGKFEAYVITRNPDVKG